MPFEPYLPDKDDLGTRQAHDLFVLREALRYIRKPGFWCQKTLHGPGRSRCAVGWIMVLTNFPLHMRQEAEDTRIVREYLVPVLPLSERWAFFQGPEEKVYHYNDRVQDQQAVVALFERAIQRVERRRMRLA